MSLKDELERVQERVGEILEDGKEILDKVKEQVDKREGVVGGIASVVEGVVDAGIEFHEGVQDKGGYGVLAKETYSDLKKIALQVGDSVSDTYKKFDDAVYPDGKFDYEKLKELLNDGAEATKQFGSKAVKSLGDLIEEGANTLSDEYRKFVPSKEERGTTYAGIGADYRGVLLRQNFEDCLAFYERADKAIPGRVKLKSNILDDIKASASSNPDELITYYARSNTVDWAKIEKIGKYF